MLLDLVKAFERVPHDVLVREAIRQGYPLTMLRLSLAAYRLDRTVRVGDATSVAMMASRGITAGSGLATTELRVLMLDIIDTALRGVIGVTVTLYVDDVSAEAAGTQRTVVDSLAQCVLAICDRMTEDRLEVSAKKSVCTASTKRLGTALSEKLARFAIRFEARVKSLGVGLGAGTRRNAQVASSRLRSFRARVGRFRRLRRAGVDTARLLRTGGNAAMTYGQAIMGVSNTLLRAQRRAAAAAAGPATGTAGQNLDLALLLADGANGGRPIRRTTGTRPSACGRPLPGARGCLMP